MPWDIALKLGLHKPIQRNHLRSMAAASDTPETVLSPSCRSARRSAEGTLLIPGDPQKPSDGPVRRIPRASPPFPQPTRQNGSTGLSEGLTARSLGLPLANGRARNPRRSLRFVRLLSKTQLPHDFRNIRPTTASEGRSPQVAYLAAGRPSNWRMYASRMVRIMIFFMIGGPPVQPARVVGSAFARASASTLA